MNSFILIFLGALAVLPLAFYAASKRRWHIPFGNGLLLACLVYLGFAVFGGATITWIGIEAAGLAIYGLFVVLGYRRHWHWIAAGWALHILWDLALHSSGPGMAYTPSWYPAICLGFDLAAAAAMFALPALKSKKN